MKKTIEEYTNALAEVWIILRHLKEEDYRKIPKNIIAIIDEYRSEDYIFEYKEEIEIKDQKLLPETRAFLYIIFRDYLATTEQRNRIKQWQMEDRNRSEQEKKEKYKQRELFANKEKEIKEGADEENCTDNRKELIEYKESFILKIIKKIKYFFGKNNNGN